MNKLHIRVHSQSYYVLSILNQQLQEKKLGWMTVDYIYPRLPQIELHPILRESVSKVLQVLQQKKYVIGNHINGVKKAYRITSEGRQAFSEVEASKLRFERVVKEGKCEENN